MTGQKKFEGSLLDEAVLHSRKEIGEDFYSLLIDTFSSEVSELLDKVSSGLAECDREIIRQLCHKLKGMSINVGAVALSQLAQNIEEELYLEDFQIIKSAVLDLGVVYRETIKQIKSLP